MKIAINIIKASRIYAHKKIENLEDKRIIPNMMTRRRLTRNAKIMLYLADKCDFKDGKIVYASAFGELQATAKITDSILNETPISPTQFQNSVYNTAPSYFSMINGDKDEIITISSGMKSSLDALKTASLQALISNERVLCVATECLDIDNIKDVNVCTNYLEAGACVILEIAKDEIDARDIKTYKDDRIIKSLRDLIDITRMHEEGFNKIFVEL